MQKNKQSRPFSLKNAQIKDDFWNKEVGLIRKEVIPYQWDALNDNVPGAAPSFCMRNFKTAGKMNEDKTKLGDKYVAPVYTFRGFEALPEDPDNLEDDKFYGFVFQDTDFSKWIEAVAYILAQYEDPELESIADGAIDIVCKAQQEDGYLDTYYIINGRDKEFTNLRDHHELYCLGHLIEGAVAYYEATGKDKLLKAAMRFADYVDSVFGYGEGKINGYPGHEIAEMALIRLYDVTGEKKYYELAKYFVEERGVRPYYFDKEEHPDIQIKGHENEERYEYNQAHKPVRMQDEAVGHAVRAVYLYSGMADVARISDDEQLFDTCKKLWDNIVNQKMYITGGIGGTHIGEAFSFNYDLPSDTAYAETCASIGMAFFSRRMLEIEPDSRYADIMERELYNGILSGIALDGKSFFYVNPLEVNPIACKKDERKFHVKPIRQKWFGCACCPPNLARFLSSIVNYAYTENDNTLFVHMYIGAKLVKCIGETANTVEITSEMPWSGKVSIRVRANDKSFRLALRIPDWCYGDYEISGFDGQSTIDKGYIYLTRDWESEEMITLNFSMDAKFIESRLDVRENIGKVAIRRGPIVYCLEETDNGKDLHLLSVDTDSTPQVGETEINGVKAKTVCVSGRRIKKENVSSLYTTAADYKYEDIDLKYIPYFMWANRGENEMQVWTSRKG